MGCAKAIKQHQGLGAQFRFNVEYRLAILLEHRHDFEHDKAKPVISVVLSFGRLFADLKTEAK